MTTSYGKAPRSLEGSYVRISSPSVTSFHSDLSPESTGTRRSQDSSDIAMENHSVHEDDDLNIPNEHLTGGLQMGSGLDDFEDFENVSLIPGTTNLGQNEALNSLASESNKSNLIMAFMNMANSIIGAGIIGQAYAVRQAGLAAGIVLLIALTIVIDWTIRLMVTNAKMSGTDSFQATVSHCFGKPGLILISVAQGAFAFGGSMAFCVIIGDTIPHVMSALFPKLHTVPFIGFILTNRRTVIVLFTLLISYPLALNRSISKLAKASGLALVSMLIIVITVVVRGPSIQPESAHFSVPLLTVNSGIFQGISVISFAFVCHHNSLLIYQSLKQPTMDRFAFVTHWSTGVSMAACMVLGIGGFIVFKDQTKGNILNNFPENDTMANVARFCFGFNMFTTLPLEIFVCREVILNYFLPGQTEHSTRIHFITTTVLVISAMSVSLFTCNLGAILELVGASSACTMAYILPPMCFLKLSAKKLIHKLPSYSCIVFGFVVMCLSTVQTVVKLISGSDEEHCVL